MRKQFTLILLVAVMLFSIAGCSSSDDAGTAGTTTPSTQGATTPSTQTEPAEPSGDGTREDPFSLGQAVPVGPWEIAVVEVNTDANDLIAQADAANEPPKDGHQYVLVSVNAKYLGSGTGRFWTDMAYRFYGSLDNTFMNGGTSDAVPPTPIAEAPEVLEGESVSGNLVSEVLSDQIDGGAVMMEYMSDDVQVFFAVK